MTSPTSITSCLKVLLTTMGQSRHTPILISLVLHLAILPVIATLWEESQHIQIENGAFRLDLVEERMPEFSENKKSEEVRGYLREEKRSPKRGAKKSGIRTAQNAKLVTEKAKTSRETVMLASLDNLFELRTNFRFALREIRVDSLGAFSPILGSAPDTDFLMDGIANGFGSGTRKGLRIRSWGDGGNPACPSWTPIDTSYIVSPDSTELLHGIPLPH